jgi:amidase
LTLDDPLNAFCRDNHVERAPTGRGSLDGLSFAVKDCIDIAGTRTGFGQPDWLRTHPAASATAPVVSQLLAAGARATGRTICDELTFSLNGENVHYGTPANPRCPDRVPGGSSSGSASAVAGGAVDFALGTDTAGSVRLPASYCGIFGIRTSHAIVPSDGILPLSPSFDTVGWFARDAVMLERVGDVLLAATPAGERPERLVIARDALALVEPAVRAAVEPALARLRRHFGSTIEIDVSHDGLASWMECFRTIQGAEVWANLGAWVETTRPSLAPAIAERIAWCRTVTGEQADAALEKRRAIRHHLEATIRQGDVLCLPTAPRAAPLRGTSAATAEVTYRFQAISLLCIAGLASLPQVNLPLASVDGCPLGVSLIGAHGTDRALLRATREIMAQEGAGGPA